MGESSNVRTPEINILVISGRLVKDPVVEILKNDQTVCNFRICNVKSPRANSGGSPKFTYTDVKCWNEIAKYVSKYLQKRDPVVVTGRLEMEEWTNKDGVKCSKLFVKADKVSNITWKDAPVLDEPPASETDIDDIPF